jgi:excinuclease ABC subunit C
VNKNIVDIVHALPQTPGVYKYIDKNGVVIYVGKAKNLKKRVSSYFMKNNRSYKTNSLVKNIADIKFVVVDNESDALLLENILIKKMQPKYNVLLKDDKTYPWICITNEVFPKVIYTRNKVNDDSEYYGPFTSVYTIKTLLNLIRSLYPIRTCNLALTEENIKKNKFKICMEYHIGNCMAPCIGNIDEETYNEYIKSIRKAIKGDLQLIRKYLKTQMQQLASEYKYEDAAKIKAKMDIVDNYCSKSTIVNTNISNVEAYGFSEDINSVYVNYLRVQNGAIIGAHSIELKKKIDEPNEDMLLYAIFELRSNFNSSVKNLILPFEIDYNLDGVKFEYPKKGDKLKLLELAQRNAKFFMLERHKQVENKSPEKHTIRRLETLQKDLYLNELPVHIECFDNSNIQGTHPVAACIVFKNAKPSKKDYRHYNIKTVEGPNDFASMSEIVYRRYNRLLNEKADLPQLIIIDGGKGQLGAAVESLKKLGLYGKLGVIGIAKRLEEIYFPDDSIPLYLDKNSESLKIIQQARDEAHRFGISFHRNKRSSNFIKTELEEIKGIGEKTIDLLLQNSKSINNIKKLKEDELAEIIGKSKAKIVFDFFHEKEND